MSVCHVCDTKVTAADRPYAGPCTVCGTVTCPAHTYFYTDESNAAISMSARPMCFEHRGAA